MPLSSRKKDIFFVVCFSFFAFSSFFSDSWHALGLLEGDAFWSRANRWYGEIAQDHASQRRLRHLWPGKAQPERRVRITADPGFHVGNHGSSNWPSFS